MKNIFHSLFLLMFVQSISFAQVLSLEITVKSSFFKGKEDSLSLKLKLLILERYTFNATKNNQPIYPISIEKNGKYTYSIIVKDTLVDEEKKHKVEAYFLENDLGGALQKNILLDSNFESILEETLRWASVDLAVYGNVSYTVNTTSKNINSKLLTDLKISNINILFKKDKKTSKKNFQIFKSIICNKYNNVQNLIIAQLEQNKIEKYCNIFFHEKEIPKNILGNYVTVTYSISQKGNFYFLKQNTVGKYIQKKSEKNKKISLEISKFEKYPIIYLRELSGSAYYLIHDVLELE